MAICYVYTMADHIIIAHRGDARHFPENSWLAFHSALEHGASYIECDVQLSADLHPVLFHDRDLERLCQQTGAVHDYEYAELMTLSLSYEKRFGERFRENRLTDLVHLVSMLQQYPGATLFVELKRISLEYFGVECVLSHVLPLLSSLQDRCVIISYNFSALQEARRKGWKAVGFVTDQWSTLNEKRIRELAPKWCFCDYEGLPDESLFYLPGTHIAVFEVPTIELARSLWKRGIDAVETFNIRELTEALRHG